MKIYIVFAFATQIAGVLSTFPVGEESLAKIADTLTQTVALLSEISASLNQKGCKQIDPTDAPTRKQTTCTEPIQNLPNTISNWNATKIYKVGDSVKVSCRPPYKTANGEIHQYSQCQLGNIWSLIHPCFHYPVNVELQLTPNANKKNGNIPIISYTQDQAYGHSLVKDLNAFIKPYGNNNLPEHSMDCQFDADNYRKDNDTFCIFRDMWLQGYCAKTRNWGFDRESPCFLLSLNQIVGWVPDVYTNLKELPMEIPPSLVQDISKIQKVFGQFYQMVWLSCDGKDQADRDNFPEIKLYPFPGFPAYYFPYMKQLGYLSPLVGVNFLKVPHGKLINIECRAWAKNIDHSAVGNPGVLNFQLLVK